MTHAAIIILAWNGTNYLPACLEAVLAQDGPPAEVIVVDNASTDDSREIVRRYAPRVRLIENTHNLGFSGGNNVGLAAVADAEVVILLNQDTVVHPGWLKAMLATFALDDRIGIVGCKALYPDGRIQHAGARLNRLDSSTTHIGQYETDHGQYDTLADMDYVTGASFAIHRRVLARLGGLNDQFYPAYYEEIDYCLRAQRAGFRVVYQPRAVMVHHETTSVPKASMWLASLIHRNRLLLACRHWSEAELMALLDNEQAEMATIGHPDELFARGRAYATHLLTLPMLAEQRQHDRTLGEPWSVGQLRELTHRLQTLRLAAYQRMAALIMAEPPPVFSVSLPGLPELPAMPGLPELLPASRWDDLNALAAFEEDLAPAARLPGFGWLITRVRAWWLATFVRPYIIPILYRQARYNQQVVHCLQSQHAALHAHWQALAGHQQALTGHQQALAGHQQALAGHQQALAGHQQALAKAHTRVETTRQALTRYVDLLAEDDLVWPSNQSQI